MTANIINKFKDARFFYDDLKIYFLQDHLTEERFGFVPQLQRAMDSIILSIAGEAHRGIDKKYAIFLNRSNNSLNEMIECLEIITLDIKSNWNRVSE